LLIPIRAQLITNFIVRKSDPILNIQIRFDPAARASIKLIEFIFLDDALLRKIDNSPIASNHSPIILMTLDLNIRETRLRPIPIKKKNLLSDPLNKPSEPVLIQR
jgi:hypothetical protein